MTLNAAANYISNSSRTNPEGKVWQESIVSRIKELPGGGPETAKTLASDSFAAQDNAQIYVVGTESAVALDDLKTITVPATVEDGYICRIRLANNAQQITVWESVSGDGHIKTKTAPTANTASFRLKNTRQFLDLKLIRVGVNYSWDEITRDETLRVESMPGGKAIATLTIATNAAAPLQSLNKLIVSSGAADTLNLLTQTAQNIDVQEVTLIPNNAAHVYTITHASGGGAANSMAMSDSANYSLTGNKWIKFTKTGTTWAEIARGINLQLPVSTGSTGFLVPDGSGGWSQGSVSPSTFGGTGRRTCPTTGTLTGDYEHTGNWTTTGAIVAINFRLKCSGDISIQHNIIASTELLGGKVGPVAATHNQGLIGSGLGGGGGSGYVNGGGGAGHGGVGGNGAKFDGTSSVMGLGGTTYSVANQLCGSGGGGACLWTSGGGTGGAGGGGIYIEATGLITIGSSVTISALGAAGGNGTGGSDGGGGGGSGGGIDMRCDGAWTLGSGCTISVAGGSGGNGWTTGNSAGGGGGGGGRVWVRAGGTATTSGTVTVSGGGAGTSNGVVSVAAVAGSSGVTDIVGGATYPARTVW